jgi:hypothetical protein
VGQAAQGNRAHLLRISGNGEAHRARKEGDVTPEERATLIVGHDELLAGLSAATKDFLRDWIAETIELAEAAAEDRESERCARIAHGYYIAEGPPVAPLGSHLAIRRAAGATIAEAICASATKEQQ